MKITGWVSRDLRFPTSHSLDGSDAMNPDPDYSAAYVTLLTDDAAGLAGDGMTFTIGRGNELCVAAIDALAPRVVGLTLEEITKDMGAFWRHLTGDSQLRWVGPEKGVIHLATAAVVNAVWDLWAKSVQKPLWGLLCDLTPEELVRCIDFRWITDALSPDEAFAILEKQHATRPARIQQMLDEGFPSYTTSAGWLGYSDERLRALCRDLMKRGWMHFKIKVGRDLEDDIRRCRIIREEIGDDRKLMIDANQVWEVPQAIEWIRQLEPFRPWFVEEPTAPDDILGHATISRAVAPVRIATGEHCANRVMFKQFFQSGGMQVCQIDSCRVGGVNEILAILLMAAKFKIPVCPHAGGVGLCEYVQHLSLFDYICVTGTLEDRLVEYADHLHEHFLHPVTMRNGRYQPPLAAGYSITMRPESIAAYTYPTGSTWKSIAQESRTHATTGQVTGRNRGF